MHTKMWWRTVGEAFPADSKMAGLIWALLVVRADLSLEMRHIGTDDARVEALDNVQLFPRLYFFRGSMLSLASGCILLNRLCGDAEFKELLKANETQKTEFMAMKKQVDRAQEEFTEARDAVGGHIESSVVDSLGRVPPDRTLKLEFSTGRGLNSELACWALMATLFTEPDVELQEKEARSFLARMSASSAALFRAIELALVLYNKRYPLYPR